MVQRLLAARSRGRRAAPRCSASWVVIFFQFTLFLLIGVLLFVYYGDAGLAPPRPADRIYPAFIWNNLPPGVAGLVIAAILAAAMSNLSAALNSLASTTIMDFYRPMSERARYQAKRIPLPETGALRHHPVGRGAVRRRPGGPPLGLGAGGRALDRLHPLRFAAGRVSARPADPARGRGRGHGGHAGRPGRSCSTSNSSHPLPGPGTC